MRVEVFSPVVVGVSGTPASLAAVRLAAREAVSRDRPLRVIHVFTWPHPQSPSEDYATVRRAAARVINAALATAQSSTPGVRVTGQLVDGLPARVLVRLSRTAELLVLGGDDLSTRRRLPGSAVLIQAIARSWCPVVVARGSRPAAGPILAAVDDSPFALAALRHAVAEAARRQAPLEVVYVVAGADPQAEENGRRILVAAVAHVPTMTRSRLRLLTGDPGLTLARTSRRARMIVIGQRGSAGATLLGSVARDLLHHGACPTVFAHGTTPETHCSHPIPARQPRAFAQR